MKKGLVILGALIFLGVLISVLYAGVKAFIDDINVATAIGGLASIAIVSVFVVKIIIRK